MTEPTEMGVFHEDLYEGLGMDCSEDSFEASECIMKRDFGPVKSGEYFDTIITNLQPIVCISFYRDDKLVHRLAWRMEFVSELSTTPSVDPEQE